MTVGDHITLNYGKGLPVRDRDTSGNIPVYGSSGVTGYHSESLTDQAVVIVGRKGAAGRVELSSGPCWPIDTTYYVLPPDHIDIKYLVYTLKGLGLEQLDQSTAVPSLSRDRVYDLPLEVPDLPTQRAIVERLDALHSELDAGVASLERAKAKLKVYRQSVLQRAFSGELTRAWRERQTDLPTSEELLAEIRAARKAWYAGEVAKYEEAHRAWVDGGEVGKKPRKPGKLKAVKPISEEERAELGELPAGWCWVRLGELLREPPKNGVSPKEAPNATGARSMSLTATSSGSFLLNGATIKQTDLQLEDDSSYWLQDQDVVLQRGNTIDLVGTAAKFESRFGLFIYPDLMIRIRLLDVISPDYFVRVMQSPRMRQYIRDHATGTAGSMPKINGEIVRGMPMPVACISEQMRLLDLIAVRTCVADIMELSFERACIKSSTLFRQHKVVIKK